MTTLFLLLAAAGAAGLFLVLRAPRPAAAPGFAAELDRAEAAPPAAVPAGADRLADIEARLRRVEDALALYDLETARSRPGAPAPAPVPETPSDFVRRARSAGSDAYPAPSQRMSMVWAASRSKKDPREIARLLNMGIAEVELALKAAGMNRAKENGGWRA